MPCGVCGWAGGRAGWDGCVMVCACQGSRAHHVAAQLTCSSPPRHALQSRAAWSVAQVIARPDAWCRCCRAPHACALRLRGTSSVDAICGASPSGARSATPIPTPTPSSSTATSSITAHGRGRKRAACCQARRWATRSRCCSQASSDRSGGVHSRPRCERPTCLTPLQSYAPSAPSPLSPRVQWA